MLNADKFIPFIDQFGQFIHSDWPGKTHSLEEMQQRKQAEEKQLAENPGPDNWDDFGGYKAGPKLNATGFFRVEKYQGNWWLVDPNGNLFWSHGIDCVRMAEAQRRLATAKNISPICRKPIRLSESFTAPAPGRLTAITRQHSPYKTYDFSKANLMQKYGQDWQQLSGETAT